MDIYISKEQRQQATIAAEKRMDFNYMNSMYTIYTREYREELIKVLYNDLKTEDKIREKVEKEKKTWKI